MGNAQRRESALELGTRIAAIGGGLMAEEGQAVSIEGEHRPRRTCGRAQRQSEQPAHRRQVGNWAVVVSSHPLLAQVQAKELLC